MTGIGGSVPVDRSNIPLAFSSLVSQQTLTDLRRRKHQERVQAESGISCEVEKFGADEVTGPVAVTSPRWEDDEPTVLALMGAPSLN